MYSVYQHWDPLDVCVVGRCYDPEFFHWIKTPSIRSAFEKIASETEEDYQRIVKTLERLGVTVLRPNIPEYLFDETGNRYVPPPMTPRDHMVMIGEQFYESASFNWKNFYSNIRGDNQWKDYESVDDFLAQAPQWQINEANEIHGLEKYRTQADAFYGDIFNHIRSQGNDIISHHEKKDFINGAMISRIGKDLYVSTQNYHDSLSELQVNMQAIFPEYRVHIVNAAGHGDGVYCPVKPGLIVSLQEIKNYQETFPGWEVVYLPNQSWSRMKPFLDLKRRNQGRYWLPGFEYDNDMIEFIDVHLNHWLGFVEETVFDVNMLVVDQNNVLMFSENELVMEAFARHNVTAHICPFRHRYFWDGGIHCVTTDLSRKGKILDWFPNRETNPIILDPKTKSKILP